MIDKSKSEDYMDHSNEAAQMEESQSDFVDRITSKDQNIPEPLEPTVKDDEIDETVDDQISKLWPDG